MNNQDDGTGNTTNNGNSDPMIQQQKQSETFSDAELAYELAEITRAANRANTTIYTIDPRGLVAGSDIDEQVDPTEWSDYVRKSQDSMRVLAEETGGRCRRQHEQLRQGAPADRRGEQRLLRAGLLLEQSGPDQAPPPGRGEGVAEGFDGLLAQGVRPQSAAEERRAGADASRSSFLHPRFAAHRQDAPAFCRLRWFVLPPRPDTSRRFPSRRNSRPAARRRPRCCQAP